MKTREFPAALAAIAAAILLVPAAENAAAADVTRGEMLYKTECGSCHSESVHGRERRVARDFNEVRAWAARWSATLRLAWEAPELDDVAAYLNYAYYRYPCPPTVCKVVSLKR